MNELTRTIDEILLLYQVEPDLRDIYVEGISDKIVFERFIEKNKLEDVKIIEVQEINFKTIYDDFHWIKSNNKEKLVALNSKFEENFGDQLSGVSIILDVDFDEINNNLRTGHYLHYTDYNSLELYLYNPHTLDIFYKTILHGFPINGKMTIEKLNEVLIDKFLVRTALGTIKDIPINKFTPFEKTVKIDKGKLIITLDAEAHIRKVANNSGKMAQLKNLIAIYHELKENTNKQSKRLIRGHDYISLLFQFIDKVKNNINLTFETLERTLFQCIDYSQLKEEPLFQAILNKYAT